MNLREFRARLGAHPYLVDLLVAAGTFVCILTGAATEPHGPGGSPQFGQREVNAQTLVLALLACGVLTLRRRFPLPVLVLTSLVSVAALLLDPTSGAPSDRRAPLVFAAAIALYTVTNSTERPTSLRVGGLTVLALTGAGMLFGARPWYAQENLGIFAWTGMAAAVGEAVRNRRAVVAAIRERAERAERTREEEARRRVAEERMRIARELHDVVAHHIALVNVQAGVASHVMDQRPDQAKQALAHVRESSRHALSELQATVGLLRQSGESTAPTEPAPGLAVLDELVASFRRTGLDLTVRAPALERPGGPALPSAVDLTAYRVVQEALTNVQKHVGSGARATVRIDRAPGELEVTVVDDGAGGPQRTGRGEQSEQDAHGEHHERHEHHEHHEHREHHERDQRGEHGQSGGERSGGGHGLVGMRERAAALHGTCETGPLPGGGFRVHVRLPLRTPPPKETST